MPTNRILLAVIVLALTGTVHAADCPDAVKEAATKAHPDASVISCKSEKEKGATQYVVTMTTRDGHKVELDVLPEGRVVKTEESIPVAGIPEAVLAAFRSKAGNAEPVSAEKESLPGGKVEYEIAYRSGMKKREITIAEDGAVIEEE